LAVSTARHATLVGVIPPLVAGRDRLGVAPARATARTRRRRERLHLVLDEANAFAPQRRRAPRRRS
jgi:hypothetical protein